jgi:glycosyltransferase involved in cell wall biosynthesis
VKVVHICNAPLTPDHPDYGRVSIHPGRWALNLAMAQRKHCGIAAELLVQVPGSHSDHLTEIETVPVRYIAAPDKFRSATLFQFDARRLAKRARALAPDIVHAHGTEDAYSLAAQRTGLPSIITAQGLYFLINRKIKPALVSRASAVQFTEWLALKHARHVIAKSNYVAQELKSRFPHLILHAIPNTFDERLLNIHEPKRLNSLVFVGTISPWKGVHTLGKALVRVSREIPEVTLDIAGDSASSALPYEIEQKRFLQETLGDRVTFHGQLRVIELGRLVASSMALVAPSLEDMFGNQLIEALLLRTHGIVAEGTALAENVRRFGNGTTVPREDSQALADAIVKTLRRDPCSTVDAETARQRISDAFNTALVARRHREVYRDVLIEGTTRSGLERSFVSARSQ